MWWWFVGGGLSEMNQKRQNKVSSNLEEVEEIVWAFVLLPRWWFAWAAALGVVVLVKNYEVTNTLRGNKFQVILFLHTFYLNSTCSTRGNVS